MQYVFFMDLDGTLLRDDKSLPDNNMAALNTLTEKEISYVIASGRSYMSLKNITKTFGFNNKYGIAFNGATVYAQNPFGVMYSDTLSKKTSVNILKFLSNVNVDKEVYYYAEDMLWVDAITSRVVEYAKHSMICPMKVRSLVDACDFETNKIIVTGDRTALIFIKDAFNSSGIRGVNCCFSSDTLLEFNSHKTDKGFALQYIMEWGINKGKKSIAVGDNYNDIPMLKAADCSFAPANAPDEVKSCADIVLTSSNNDGILPEVLEKCIEK